MELDEFTDALAASLARPQDASLVPVWRWERPTPKDRVTLPCGRCGRRIAWWTAEVRRGWLALQDLNYRGWKWQGQRVPVRLRGPLVGVECQSCGWTDDGAAQQRDPDHWWHAAPELT